MVEWSFINSDFKDLQKNETQCGYLNYFHVFGLMWITSNVLANHSGSHEVSVPH